MGNVISQSNKNAFRNPWVIGWIAMVVIVFGVNVFMIAQAFIANPGLVTKNYYSAGRDLENRIHTRDLERANLGWSLTLETHEIYMGKPSAVHVTAFDKEGKPLSDAQVLLRAFRPSDSNADFSIPLAEKSPGRFVADVTFPLKGVWDVAIEVKQGEHASHVNRRILAFGN